VTVTRVLPLNNTERRALASLTKALDRLLDSEVPCVGDGNLDGVVDQEDLDQLNFWAALTGGSSSWYDFDHDGKTTQADADLITAGEFPRQCPAPPPRQGRPGPSAG
jgi:hypothetical protein